MDEHAQRVLEFGKVLRVLSRYTATEMGRRKALALAPVAEAETLRAALRRTTEMTEALREGYTLPLGSVEDVTSEVERARAGGGPLEPAVLWKISGCLESAQRVASSLQRRGSSYPALRKLGESVPTAPQLLEEIQGTVDAKGRVVDGASPELKAIRERSRRLRGKIEESLRRIIKDPSVRPHLQYPNPTMCRERYVLPVDAYSRNAVPGLVHGSSDSGATLYVEPMEVIDSGNELAEVLGEEEEEVRRILWEMTRAVAAESDAILGAIRRLGEVDLVRAKARLSAAFRMCPPEAVEPPGGRLELRDARHPLLLWLTRPSAPEGTEGERPAPAKEEDLDFEAVVPLSVRLGEDFDTLVVTGPNTGGKTVTLKTIGLACLMARAGMHVPAEKAIIPLYDAVFADIGDEQSLEQSLSTFSSHMSNIIEILQRATPRSLVLLDELGAGTDPTEGAALAEAILDRLVERGCFAAVVTHLGRLKTYATARPRVENASMDFDTATLRPTYRLTIGSAGSSNALQIADRLGLPADLLEEAGRLLNTQAKGDYTSAMEEVRMARQDAEKRRERMRYLEQEAEKMKEQYQEVLTRLQAEEDRRGADIGFQIRDTLQELLDEADNIYEDVRNLHRSLANRIREFRDGLQECLHDIQQLLAGHRLERPLKEGDEVYVIKLHKWGTVERVDERRGRAQVRVGPAQIDVEIEGLQPWGEEV